MTSSSLNLLLIILISMITSLAAFSADEDIDSTSDLVPQALPTPTSDLEGDSGEPVYYPTDDESIDYSDE